MAALKEKYQKEVRPALQEKFGYANPMLVPALKKIVVNMGVAEAAKDKNIIQQHTEELALITGQKPLVTKARKSISNFKLREGQPIGLKVTLRGARMWEFFYRFLNLSAPRIPDFRGFAKKADGQGNYSVGLNDQQIFYEVDLDKVSRTQGMNITFVTTASCDEHCLEMLSLLGFPFRK